MSLCVSHPIFFFLKLFVDVKVYSIFKWIKSISSYSFDRFYFCLQSSTKIYLRHFMWFQCHLFVHAAYCFVIHQRCVIFQLLRLNRTSGTKNFRYEEENQWFKIIFYTRNTTTQLTDFMKPCVTLMCAIGFP